MTRMVRAAVLLCAAVCCWGLSGCAASPAREAVVERFAIELAAGPGEASDWMEVAARFADDALAGECGRDSYRTGLGEDLGLLYAWSATCLMYFSDDMTDSQQEEARSDVIAFATLNSR